MDADDFKESLVEGRTNFREEDFTGEDLTNVDFDGLNLTWTQLEGADITQCTFDDCDLSRAVGERMKAPEASFTECTIWGANFGTLSPDREASLLFGCDFSKASFTDCNLNQAAFYSCFLTEARFVRCRVVGLGLMYADLSNAQLEELFLKDLGLPGAKAPRASFDRSKFVETNLSSMNLRGASFKHAVFVDCEVEGCDLQEADLRGADLRGCRFGAEQWNLNTFTGARYDAATRFPESFDPAAAGLVQSARAPEPERQPWYEVAGVEDEDEDYEDEDEDDQDEESSDEDAPAEPPPPNAVTQLLEAAGWPKYSESYPSLFIKGDSEPELRFRYTPDAMTVAIMECGEKALILNFGIADDEDPATFVQLALDHQDQLMALEWEPLAQALLDKAEWSMYWGQITGSVWHKSREQDGQKRYVPDEESFLAPGAGELTPFGGAASTFPESESRDWVVGERDSEASYYFPWGKEQAAQFPQLLTTDRCRNLAERHKYYLATEAIDHNHSFMNHIAAKLQHTVWAPGDGDQTFAYSIGLYYLYNLPDLLIIDDNSDPASVGDLAQFINALADAQIAGQLRLFPGKKLSDALASLPQSSHPQAKRFAARRFQRASNEELEEFYGFGGSFYVNYMDVLFNRVPVLVLRLPD